MRKFAATDRIEIKSKHEALDKSVVGLHSLHTETSGNG